MFCLSCDLFGEIELPEFDIWLQLAFSLLRDVSDPFFLLRRSATDPPTTSLFKQIYAVQKTWHVTLQAYLELTLNSIRTSRSPL